MKLSIQNSNNKQKAIKKKFTFEGYSLFSGEKISMEVLPGTENSGIIFYINGEKIEANINNLFESELHTTSLSKGKVKIFMVEHFMAAVWGLGIDNLEVRTDSDVVPATGASAEEYVKAILDVGIMEQGDTRKVVKVLDDIKFVQPEYKDRVAILSPFSDQFAIKLTAPFPIPIGDHTVEYVDGPSVFESDVSWARTFLRSPLDLKDLSKWERIRSLYKALPKDPRLSPIVTYTEDEFLVPLKRKDEPARHKMLDMIGDLALLGHRIHGKFKVNMPGHKFSHQIAKEISELLCGTK